MFAALRLANMLLLVRVPVINKDVKPYALMVGVPARQIGWMSQDGERLDLPLKGEIETICPNTGDRYQIKNGYCSLIE